MIIREHYMSRPDGVELYRTYSDAGYMIRQDQTGAEYSEAIDVADSPYTYSETDIPAEDDEISAEAALDILMGGDGNADDAEDGGEIPADNG